MEINKCCQGEITELMKRELLIDDYLCGKKKKKKGIRSSSDCFRYNYYHFFFIAFTSTKKKDSFENDKKLIHH